MSNELIEVKKKRADEFQEAIINSTDSKIIVEAGAGSGKALLNGSKVVTPSGYINIEDLKIGDEIFGTDGNIYNVQGVFPQGNRQIYKVTFSDGTIIKCSKDHLWSFQTSSMRKHHKTEYKTETLEKIINEIPIFRNDKRGYKSKNIYIPLNKALKFPKKQLPIKPYTLGALLGNGLLRNRGENCAFSSNDEYCINKVNAELKEINYQLIYRSKYDYALTQIKHEKKSKLITILEELQLNGKHSWEKFIPKNYLFSSIEDRLELLKGLIDTDGNFKKSLYEFTTVSKELADDVKFLAQSLGCTAKISVKEKPKYIYNGQEKIGRKAYRVYIKCPKEIQNIHFTPKKDDNKFQQCYARKSIINIEETKEYGEMTCIKTSAPDSLFMTDNFTVTHNTFTLIERVRKILESGVSPENIVVISFTNMAAEELKERLVDIPGIGDCFVGTIHSFANKIFGNSNEEYKLFTEEIQDQFMSVLIALYGRNLTMESYLEYKDLKKKVDNGLISDEELRSQFTSAEMYEINVFLYSMPNKEYPENMEKLCKKHNVITFDELLKRTTAYFKEIGGKVEYLFVDEYQDIGPLEKDFFEALNADNYFYVGDPRQALYAFKRRKC